MDDPPSSVVAEHAEVLLVMAAWALCFVALVGLPGQWFQPTLLGQALIGLVPGALAVAGVLRLRRPRPVGSERVWVVIAAFVAGDLLVFPVLHAVNRLLDRGSTQVWSGECLSTGKTRGSKAVQTVRMARDGRVYTVPGVCRQGETGSVLARPGFLGFAWVP